MVIWRSCCATGRVDHERMDFRHPSQITCHAAFRENSGGLSLIGFLATTPIAQGDGGFRSVEPWGWLAGSYPAFPRGGFADGTASTFDRTRAYFEAAWRRILPKLSDADFRAWRDQLAWTVEKFQRFARSERMPYGEGSRLIAAGLSKVRRTRFSPFPTVQESHRRCRTAELEC